MPLTPDTDAPVEHRQSVEIENRFNVPATEQPRTRGRAPASWSLLYRGACSCGWRGVWLSNPEKVAPCPQAQEVR